MPRPRVNFQDGLLLTRGSRAYSSRTSPRGLLREPEFPHRADRDRRFGFYPVSGARVSLAFPTFAFATNSGSYE